MVMSVDLRDHVEAEECQDYEAIAAAANLAHGYDDEEAEDAGCDSCLHWNDGRCEVYRRERPR